MSNEQRIFCGSGKIITTQYGEMTKLSFSEKDAQSILTYAAENGGWCNCVLKEKKTKVQGKPTHYIEIDTWKPEGGYSQRGENTAQRPGPNTGEIDDEDSIPF